MNALGLVAGIAAFLGIWIGHVAVRKVEFTAPALWLPALVFVSAGVALEGFAFSVSSLIVSAGAGIVGVTLLWDALELFRQEHRVRRGHAPANPANPRHQKMIAAPGSTATITDRLKREPL